MRIGIILVTIFLISLLSPVSTSEDSEQHAFTLSGNVFSSGGQPANSTSIKVDSMESTWSSEGFYSFEGISPGEHTVRAYFMNDGHTVVYRKIIVESDMNLDWYEGRNWITFKVFEDDNNIAESSLNTVELVETSENISTHSGRGEFGPYQIGEYYTLMSYYGGDDHSTQFIHFRMEAGSSSVHGPNDFHFYQGKNSRYGFLTDLDGNPITGASVSTESASSITNSDGFFLLQNMEVGSTQNLSVSNWGYQIIDPINIEISDGEGWLNITSTVEIEMPDYANFTTQIITSPLEQITIDWSGGEYIDFYSLYLGEELVYRGEKESFNFVPERAGNYQFRIESSNSNGSKINPSDLQVIVLPNQPNSDLWSQGMSWNYSLLSTPEFYQNKTYTAIGSEPIIDAFGNNRSSYILRVSDEEYEEGEKAFRWVDSESLMTIHTFWVDAPSSSSYYMEGFLGWNFTDPNGIPVNPLNYVAGGELTLHFNRTNIIGVPGHPNGYADTMNSVTVTHGVELTTSAGTFITTHLEITDNNDGFVSWEMWYNETVRNWVKIIDKLPGSHSDEVISELTSFEVPTSPQFITEDNSNFSDDDIEIEWAQFPGAQRYKLIENGEVVYLGEESKIKLINRNDGEYNFQILAEMTSGQIIQGKSITVEVFFVLEPPEFISKSHSTINSDQSILIWSPVDRSLDEYFAGQVIYSVWVMPEEGPSYEAYNGPENQTLLEGLETGINRIRVKATLENGKTSEFSDSIFITFEEPEENEDSLPFLPALTTLTLLVFASRFSITRRNESWQNHP